MLVPESHADRLNKAKDHLQHCRVLTAAMVSGMGAPFSWSTERLIMYTILMYDRWIVCIIVRQKSKAARHSRAVT